MFGFTPVQIVGLLIVVAGLAGMCLGVVRLQALKLPKGEKAPSRLMLSIAFSSMATTLGAVLLLLGRSL